MYKVIGALIASALIVMFLLLPLIAIWSINTLFSTGIEYNIYTYFASLFMLGIVGIAIKNN